MSGAWAHTGRGLAAAAAAAAKATTRSGALCRIDENSTSTSGPARDPTQPPRCHPVGFDNLKGAVARPNLAAGPDMGFTLVHLSARRKLILWDTLGA